MEKGIDWLLVVLVFITLLVILATLIMLFVVKPGGYFTAAEESLGGVFEGFR